MSAKSSTTPLALLIGQQPFFAGLSVQQVQVLADSLTKLLAWMEKNVART